MISTGPPGSWVVGVGLGFYSSVEVAEFQGRLQLRSFARQFFAASPRFLPFPHCETLSCVDETLNGTYSVLADFQIPLLCQSLVFFRNIFLSISN